MGLRNARCADGSSIEDPGVGRLVGNASLPAFSVRCEARSNALSLGQNLSFSVSQRIRMQGVEQTWDTVTIQCGEEHDGTLSVKIVISNPDWDGPLQIANLRSRPSDSNSLTALGCNLDHESVVPST